MINFIQKERSLLSEAIREMDVKSGNNSQNKYTLTVLEKDSLDTISMLYGKDEGKEGRSDFREPFEHTRKGICDAADCDREAAETIEVKAGKFGMIQLSVCSNCVKKFED